MMSEARIKPNPGSTTVCVKSLIAGSSQSLSSAVRLNDAPIVDNLDPELVEAADFAVAQTLKGQPTADAIASAEPEHSYAAIPRPRQLAISAQAGFLLFSDLAALFLSVLISYFLWPHRVLGQPLNVYAQLVPLLAVFPPIYAVEGLYPGFGLGAAETIRRLALGTSIAFMMLAGASFVLKAPHEYSRVGFALAWLLGLGVIPATRFMVLSIVRRFSWWGEAAVVIGNHIQINQTLDALHDSKSLGYRVIGALCLDSSTHHNEMLNIIPVFGGLEAIAPLAEAGIRTVLAWDGRSLDGYPTAINPLRLDQLQKQFRHVVMLRGNDALPVEHVKVRNLGAVLGIEFSNELLRHNNRIIKRGLDVIFGSLFLLLSAPVILACGLLIKLLSHGPIFFVQQREGLDGRKIKIWKLRTMYVDAEQRLEEHLDTDPKLRREWEEKCKLTHDPRVVRGIGPLLRRFSIDELPQLWCVVTGAMSLVGPRPLPDYHLNMFRLEFMELRRRVRPGITGLWQITVRSDGNFNEHQRYDSYYIRNWSVWLDIYILVRTIAALMTRRGAC